VLCSYDLTKIHLSKTFTFTPQAQQRYQFTISSFIQQNHRDVHYDFSEDKAIAGFCSRLMAVRETAVLPCSASLRAYWLFSFLTLTWFVRAHLSACTGAYHYDLVKHITA
jgi:hypothetical protein